MGKLKKIIIDPGHGGLDRGHYTTYPSKMYVHSTGDVAYEGVINREISKVLYRILKWIKSDIDVLFTVNPDDPTDLSLEERRLIIERLGRPEDTLVVSVHCNAYNTKVRGFEVFTTGEDDKSDLFATTIYKNIESFYNRIGLKMRSDYQDDDPDKEAEFYILRNNKNIPSVLVECLFFDNKEDFKLLSNRNFIFDFSYHLAKGILDI